MPRNTSVTLGGHFGYEEKDIKLQGLRAKLQAGEDSPVVEGFDGAQFIANLHHKHFKLSTRQSTDIAEHFN